LNVEKVKDTIVIKKTIGRNLILCSTIGIESLSAHKIAIVKVIYTKGIIKRKYKRPVPSFHNSIDAGEEISGFLINWKIKRQIRISNTTTKITELTIISLVNPLINSL